MPRKKLPDIDEKDLVAWLRTGEHEAFGTLYDQYSAAIYGVVFRIIQSDAAAEDILQESFVKIWRSFAQYDESKGRLFTWMLNIARNLAIDHYRSLNRNPTQNQTVTFDVDMVDVEHNCSFNPNVIGLRELVNALKPDQIEIIEHLYYRGLTHTEAAEEINIPLGTVKTRLHSALKSLRMFFREKEKNNIL
ncbi:ECF RNA polymerase sigma factor SigK [Ignavibacteria bacterium]|nr:sigma-70 family RNA polymerase sigma factor [Bacteroidota bacterium]MCZ2132411.1 sigma-70 family RNA polymerase sigma factor [Bacteroidota bacterium]